MAFLIDPKSKSIRPIDKLPTSLDEIYRLLRAEDQAGDMVEMIRLSNGDVVLVDEEGSYKKDQYDFEILLTDYKGDADLLPLVNKAIVLRFENGGGDDERIVEPLMSLAQLQEIVEWE